MSAGFYLVSGVIYLNMGSEIMFVLSNRMKAQKIQPQVAQKILCDITLVMFKRSFIQPITKPQMPLSIPTLYQIFTKVVNSSVMKLDKNSMQKLFYLILMTFKKQLFLLSSPLQLYTLTITHLQDVADMLRNNIQAVACITDSIEIFKKQSQKFNFMSYYEIKQQILSMLQSYKSRIVLFCETGFQDEYGNLIYSTRNTHFRKGLGLAQNHQNIEFPSVPAWSKAKNLPYANYKNWKTVLGKDDYDNARGSSKSIGPKTKDYINQGQEDNNKSISQMLGIKNMKLDSFEVHLDIFEDTSRPKKIEQKKAQKVKTVQSKLDNDIKNKIQKQFDDLGVEDKGEGNDEIDLLQLMDS